jgi:chromosome segregation ATPase
METFSNAIKCRQCRCVSESPVILPCCHSVCKKHEQERTRVVCSECECEYEVPKGGFQENIALSQIIASGISEVELRHEHKDAIKASNQVKEKLDQVKKLVMDPIYYIHERIGELKMRVDLAREEFKLKIDDEAESILRNLEEYENECKQSSSSNDIDSKVKEIEEKLEKTKLDLDMWTKYLDKFKIDCKECEIIQRKCKETVDKLQEQLELFQESLLMSNFEKTEKVVNGFEKLGILFDYKLVDFCFLF